jgi:hypothetical protein
MANTYVKIASVTAGAGGVTSFDFTNIPSTYSDLVLKLSARSSSTAVDVRIVFNANTSNYSRRNIMGNGSAASSSSFADAWIGQIGDSNNTASTFASTEVYIPDYAGSTNKSYAVDQVQETNGTTAYMNLLAGLWSNTAAITSIKIEGRDTTITMVQHSTATLYGISRT